MITGVIIVILQFIWFFQTFCFCFMELQKVNLNVIFSKDVKFYFYPCNG